MVSGFGRTSSGTFSIKTSLPAPQGTSGALAFQRELLLELPHQLRVLMRRGK